MITFKQALKNIEEAKASLQADGASIHKSPIAENKPQGKKVWSVSLKSTRYPNLFQR